MNPCSLFGLDVDGKAVADAATSGLAAGKLGYIQTEVGDRLLVELTRRLQPLALLELLHGFLKRR